MIGHMVEGIRIAEATLEIELDPEAPAGALVTGQGERRTFSSWIEFAAAVEDWRQAEESNAI
jgi:hypothetical protein